jgi:hypothetical protein
MLIGHVRSPLRALADTPSTYASCQVAAPGLKAALIAFCVFGAAFLAPARGSAQEKGIVSGAVMTAEHTPIAGATVSVIGTELHGMSADNGHFSIAGVPSGAQRVEIKMIGYAKTEQQVDVQAGKTKQLEVVLATEAIRVTGVETRAAPNVNPQLRGFEERKARGVGKFFTRDEIARMQPRLFTDILRRVPGMQISSATGSSGPTSSVQTQRTAGVMGNRPCPILFFVNGAPFPLARDAPINQFISADEVVAVEVYTGTSQIPPQFNSAMYDARCGVVVIWTRNGKDPTRGQSGA